MTHSELICIMAAILKNGAGAYKSDKLAVEEAKRLFGEAHKWPVEYAGGKEAKEGSGKEAEEGTSTG